VVLERHPEYEVRLANNQKRSIDASELERPQPVNHDTVYVRSGENAGQLGSLFGPRLARVPSQLFGVGIDKKDGIVKLEETGDIVVLVPAALVDPRLTPASRTTFWKRLSSSTRSTEPSFSQCWCAGSRGGRSNMSCVGRVRIAAAPL
jgi:hypothetical protein